MRFLEVLLHTRQPIDIVAEVIGALFARVIRYENLQYTTGDGTTSERFLTNCSSHAVGAVALDLDVAPGNRDRRGCHLCSAECNSEYRHWPRNERAKKACRLCGKRLRQKQKITPVLTQHMGT